MARPTTVTSYMPGNVVRLQGLFVNTSDVAADPSARTLVIEQPDGTETSYTLTSSVTGTWYYDFTIPNDAAAGTWRYWIAGTATIIAADEWRFEVEHSYVQDN